MPNSRRGGAGGARRGASFRGADGNDSSASSGSVIAPVESWSVARESDAAMVTKEDGTGFVLRESAP